MADVEDDVLVVGGIVAAGFLLLKKILPTFGLSDDQKQSIANTEAIAPQDNPFSPAYQPMIDYFDAEDTTGLGIDGYVKNLKVNYDFTGDNTPLNFANPVYGIDLEIAKGAEIIWNAFGFFHLKGYPQDAINVMTAVSTKVDVAAMAAYLWYNYNVDLWSWLKNGAAGSLKGVGGEALAAISDRINALPVK